MAHNSLSQDMFRSISSFVLYVWFEYKMGSCTTSKGIQMHLLTSETLELRDLSFLRFGGGGLEEEDWSELEEESCFDNLWEDTAGVSSIHQRGSYKQYIISGL